MIFSAQLFCAQEKAYKKKYEEHLKKLRKIIELFVNNSLSKKTLLEVFGKDVKIDESYYKEKKYIYITTDNYSMYVAYIANVNKRAKIIKLTNLYYRTKYLDYSISIKMLVDIFGKWTYYSNDKRMTKSPYFYFEKKIDNKKKVSVYARGIYGPFKRPMKCVCIRFSINIEKIKNEK